MTCYCRTPANVFAAAGAHLWLPPMNANAQLGHSGRQPVRYTDVRTLIRSVDGALPAGSALPVVDMDWRTGEAAIYEDIEDASNGLVFARTKFRSWSSPRSSVEYAEEIGCLLQRGHSLAEATCDCFHHLEPDRCLELGIRYDRKGQCPASASRDPNAMWSCERIAAELAVEDLLDCPCSDGVMLMDFLREHSERFNIRMHGSFLASGHSAMHIRGPDELLSIANKAWPLPVSLPDPRDSYDGVERDAQAMAAQGELRLFPGRSKGAVTVFGELFCADNLKVDADVRALWHTA